MFGLREKEFLRHIGIFGITGSGKSNAVFKIIDELVKKGKHIFVLDWKAQYRHYLSHRPDKDILIFGIGNKNIPSFQFNPLIPPPGIDPAQYLEHICQIVANSYYCGEGVISLLRKSISSLYDKFKVYTGSATKFPTFQDILDMTKEQERKGRSRDWQESTIRSLEAICSGGLSRIVNVQSPTMQLSELLNRHVILELGDLSESQKKFVIQSLLTYLYYYSMKREIREELKNVIIIEEAHHILRDHSKSTVKEPISDVILKEIREFGTGIIIVDQNPSLISVPALANNYTTIGMYTKHGSDISALSKAMFLSQDEKEYLGRLECGYGIVKLAGRVFDPFLVKFPLMPIKKGSITDSFVEKHMELQGYSRYSALESSQTTGSGEILTYSGSDKKEESAEKSDIPACAGDDTVDSPASEQMRDIMTRMVKDIDDYPFDGIASRNKRLNISSRKGHEAIERLMHAGLISKQEIREPSGRRILLEIIPEVRIALIEQGANLKLVDPKKDGGIVHRYWNHTIAQMNRRRGFQVELEKHIDGNGFIDQVVKAGNKQIAIEIETGKSSPIETIEHNLSLGFDLVVCIATDDIVLGNIENKLKAEKKSDSRIRLLTVLTYKPEMLLD